jgi:hypothetical protein
VPAQQWEDEAGGSEDAGRVRARAEGTTGVCERGMHAKRELGNVGEPPLSATIIPDWGPGDHRPRRGRGLPPEHEPVRDPRTRGSRHGIGKRATSAATREG